MRVAKATVRIAGSDQLLKAGKLYEDDDPAVVANPDLFESPEEHQVRKQRPQSTAELGERSMMNHGSGVETARSAPGEQRDVAFPCPTRDETGCEQTFETVRGAKAHARQVHR
jgi:hypothetical protein